VQVLDKGSLDLMYILGTDKSVVNAARISFDNAEWWNPEFNEKDEKLIRYLIKNKHVSPFYHPQMTFRVKLPISVQRQWITHKVGTAHNSESTRYSEMTEEYIVPEVWRAQSVSNKQGSSGEIDPGNRDIADKVWSDAMDQAFGNYRYLLSLGVAKEQARDVLPLGTYTSCVWTASLQAVLHFIELRDDDHAQFEIRQYAKAMRTLVEPHFPVTFRLYSER
jgi:thymidylate synthase (FAD)